MVSSLLTPRGKEAKNQYVIRIGGLLAFQSYGSIIYISLPNGNTYLGTHYNYSTTTRKYLNIFLRDYSATIPKEITANELMNDIIRTYLK